MAIVSIKTTTRKFKNIYIYIYINTKKFKKCQENYCIGKVFFKIEMRWLIGLWGRGSRFQQASPIMILGRCRIIVKYCKSQGRGVYTIHPPKVAQTKLSIDFQYLFVLPSSLYCTVLIDQLTVNRSIINAPTHLNVQNVIECLIFNLFTLRLMCTFFK